VGEVRYGGHGVGGARVTVGGADGRRREAETDARGAFAFPGLRAGRYAVRAVAAQHGVDLAAYRDSVEVGKGAGALPLLLTKAPAVAGRVVADGDAPLAGVDVTLSEGPFSPLPRRVRTDGEGRFRIAAVLPGHYQLGAGAPGYVGASLHLATSAIAVPGADMPGPGPQARGGLPPLVIRLARGAVLGGEVLDEDQRPIAGARISLVRADGPAAPELPPPGGLPGAPSIEPAGELGVVHATIPYPPLQPPTELGAGGPTADGASAPGGVVTDGRGRFRIGDLLAGKVVVRVTHAAWLEGRSDEVMLLPGVERAVRVVLHRGQLLRGRVLGNRGAAVSGAELWIDGALATVTDEGGRFELRRLAGSVEVEVRARGHAPARRSIDPATEPEVDLQLGEPTERLSGVVVDGRGFPVVGARVVIEAAGGERRSAATDRVGGFQVEGCPGGPLVVRVSQGEHLKSTVVGVVPGDDLRITLVSGGVVEGEVVEERGAVPRGGRVTIEDSLGERRSTTVDANGRFRVGGCAPGPATVRAEAPGCLPAAAPVELAGADYPGEVVLRDLRFALLPSGSVAGTVLDDRGLPVAGADVGVGAARTRTDAAGRFRVGPLPLGRVAVTASSAVGKASDSVVIERGRGAEIELRLR
jgi:protocatechuate 3,4-dioxygenase beta subunit